MKKKFTMLFAALLAFVGVAKAQDAATYADGLYKVYWQADQRGCLAYHATDYPERPQLAGVVNHNPNGHYALDAEGINLGWYLYTSTETQKSYLFEATTGKFITIKTDETVGNGKACVLSENVTAEAQFNLFASNGNVAGSYLLRYVLNEKNYHFCSGCGSNKGNNPVRFSTDGQSDGGNRFVFVTDALLSITDDVKNAAIAKIQAFESSVVDMVYVYKYGETEWGRETIEAKKGEAYPAPAARYGVTYTLPEGNVPASAADNTEVEVTCSLAEGFPFVFAETYNAVTAEWYSLTLRAKKVAYVGDSFVYSNDVTTGSFFTFTGNPITGYTIYNYDGGNKAVWADSPANGTAIGLVETANDTWELLGTNTADNYLFKVKGTSNSYMHDYNTKFSYWLSNSAATDPGSYVTITSPSAGLQALVEKAGLLTSSANNGVGTITTASATTLNTAVDATKEANTLAEIVNATNSLQGAYQGALNDIVLPEEGKYYTLVSSCTDDHRANQSVYVNREGRMQFANAGEVASDFARVFQFVPTTTEGKFYIYNVENNTYMNTVGYALALGADAAKPVTITNLGKDNIVKIVPDGQNMMHTQDAGSVIVGWNNDSYTNGSAWTIVETEAPNLADVVKHTLTVTNAGWSTLVLPHNTTIPANVEVFVASEIKDDKVMLSAVEDVLPAHTPVIIKATANDYVFNYTAEEGSVESNLLEGSVFNLNVSEDGYVLANGEMGVGLYKAKFNVVDLNNEVDADGDGDATNDYTAFLNNANKAYLPAPAGASAAMFSFGRGEGTTGIETAVSGEQTVVIYDLAGRRVEKMEKGIYIVNGKKVIR